MSRSLRSFWTYTFRRLKKRFGNLSLQNRHPKWYINFVKHTGNYIPKAMDLINVVQGKYLKPEIPEDVNYTLKTLQEWLQDPNYIEGFDPQHKRPPNVKPMVR